MNAFQTEPFTLPMPRSYVGDRILSEGVIMLWRATCTGEIDTFDVWLRQTVETTSAIFNLYVDGDAVFAGGARPTIAPGSTHVQKTGVGFAVELGQLVEVTVEQCPAAGIPSPVEANARVIVS